MKNYLSNFFGKKENAISEKMLFEAQLSLENAMTDKVLLLNLSRQHALEKANAYLQEVLEIDEEAEIPLKEELDRLQRFVELFAGSSPQPIFTKMQYTVDDEKPFFIHPFILYPLVQNALHNGYNTMQKLPMKVRVTQEGNTLKMEVSNRVNHYLESQENIPLIDYYKSRLKVLYPEKHNLFINSNSNLFKCTLSVTK